MHRKARRHQKNHEILFGVHPVREAILQKKRNFQKLYLNKNKGANKRLQEIHDLAGRQNILIEETGNEQLEQLTGRTSHQGTALQCSPLPESSWESLKSEKRECLDTLVVLDQIEDPQNLGAIIRSCGFFKMKALVLPKDHSCSISPIVSKASAGVAEWFPVIRETNINRMLEKKKKEGYWVLGLDAQADDEIDSLKVDRPFVLVLGNEGQGLRPLVQKNCDLMYRIGGNSDVDSLNVSNAAAIALHKFYTSSTNLGLVPELQSSKT